MTICTLYQFPNKLDFLTEQTATFVELLVAEIRA